MDEAKEKQVIAYMNALELYREMVSKVDSPAFDKSWDEIKLATRIQFTRKEMKLAMTKLGEVYFEGRLRELLGATRDGKLIENHSPIV